MRGKGHQRHQHQNKNRQTNSGRKKRERREGQKQLDRRLLKKEKKRRKGFGYLATPMTLMAISKARKVEALTGAARSMQGMKPLKKPLRPSAA